MMRGAPYSTQYTQKAKHLSNTPVQQACVLTMTVKTPLIGKSLQSLFDGNEAGDHAKGHGNHKDVVWGDAITDESGEHEDHDKGHEDQLSHLFGGGSSSSARRRMPLSKKIHSARLRLSMMNETKGRFCEINIK